MLWMSQPCELAGLGRRGYYHANDARSSRWVEALQSDDKDFLPIAPKADQLIFVRWSFESILPLQAIRINIRADCAEEVLHSFPFTLVHQLPCLVDNRLPARALLQGDQHICTGNGYHEISWIYVDCNSLTYAGTVVCYDNGFPARTSDGAESGLDESRRLNPTEVGMLDC